VELYLHSPNTPSWCGAQLKTASAITRNLRYRHIILHPTKKEVTLTKVVSSWKIFHHPNCLDYPPGRNFEQLKYWWDKQHDVCIKFLDDPSICSKVVRQAILAWTQWTLRYPKSRPETELFKQ
jgi:hypothetical protein